LEDPTLELASQERADLRQAYQELKDNEFVFVGPDPKDDTEKTWVIMAASDASNGGKTSCGGAGWTLFGKFDPEDMPSNPPARVTNVIRRFEGAVAFMAILHIYIQEVYAACETVKDICRRGHRNCLIILAVDNSAARAALNRGLSINDFVGVMILEMMHVLAESNNTLDCVPVPGHFNSSDWPSRNLFLIPKEGGGYEKERKPVPPGKPKCWGEPFDPVAVTWQYLLDGWMGRRRQQRPDYHHKEAGIHHREPDAIEMEEQQLEETLQEWLASNHANLSDEHFEVGMGGVTVQPERSTTRGKNLRDIN
jgi:hypothetical protein